MFSVASFRYREALAVDGGPIEEIEEGRFSVFGELLFQANARLRKDLYRQRPLQIYSDAQGTGVHQSAVVARHKAVSRRLNGGHISRRTFPRGAPNSASISTVAQMGWQLSTAGCAPARRAARLEAIERFCVLNWWEGRMNGAICATKWPGIGAVSFTPRLGGSAVILYMKSKWGFHSYGHAAAETFIDACHHARVELARHELGIQKWVQNGDPKPPRDLFERRACFATGRAKSYLMRDSARIGRNANLRPLSRATRRFADRGRGTPAYGVFCFVRLLSVSCMMIIAIFSGKERP